MPLSKIKVEYQGKKIAFGKRSDLPIGQRGDIDDLAIIAHESQDNSLLKLFETLPPLADLKRTKTLEKLKKIQEAKPNQAIKPTATNK